MRPGPAVLALCLALADGLPAAGLSVARPARPALLAFCSSAAKSLDLLLPRLADPELAALLEAKVRAGVAVRLILDPGYKSNRKAAGTMRAARLKFRWLGGAKPGAMSARVLLADKARVLCGSMEATPESLDERLESWLESGEAALAGDATARFEALWAKAKVRLEDALVLGDALERLGDPRGEEERTPRIKKRSQGAAP